MLSPKERSNLKAKANHLNPSLTIGKGDITENIIVSIDAALSAHELIKIKLLNTAMPPREAAEHIVKATDSDLVSIIGRVITIYRVNPKNHKIDTK